jgi:hypothetical protein
MTTLSCRDMFIEAAKDGACDSKRFLISALAVTRNMKPQHKWDIIHSPDGVFWFDGETLQSFSDAEVDHPAVDPYEEFVLPANTFINQPMEVKTTIGDIIFNVRVIIPAFGDKVRFIQGPISIKAVEAMISTRLTADPDNQLDRDPSKLYVSEYLKFGQYATDMVGLMQIVVPAASPKSLSTHPEMAATRAKDIEENKDKLHDTATVTKMMNKWIALDKEHLKDDRASDFIRSEKTWSTARLRMYVSFGLTGGFDGVHQTFIEKPLIDGWDKTQLPLMFTSVRAGSFNRGALTALGGEIVKFYMRVFQNCTVRMEDCGSTVGIRHPRVYPADADLYVGYYSIEADKSIRLLTEENIKEYYGKPITLRSTGWCKTSPPDYCMICSGKQLAAAPLQIGAGTAEIGSDYMYVFMKRAHARAAQTVPLRYETFLT